VTDVAYGSNDGVGTTISSPGSKAANATMPMSSSAPLPMTIWFAGTPRRRLSAARRAEAAPSG
jgi:hypothetical protein